MLLSKEFSFCLPVQYTRGWNRDVYGDVYGKFTTVNFAEPKDDLQPKRVENFVLL